MAKARAKKKEIFDTLQKPDLTIGIKNFGPITSGEISVKPLTILVGPNNSGKSYAAMLTFSVEHAQTTESLISWLTTQRSFASSIRRLEGKSVAERLEHVWKRLRAGKSTAIDSDLSGDIHESAVKFGAELLLEAEIRRTFASDMRGLGRRQSNSFSVAPAFPFFSCSVSVKRNQLRLVNHRFPEGFAEASASKLARFLAAHHETDLSALAHDGFGESLGIGAMDPVKLSSLPPSAALVMLLSLLWDNLVRASNAVTEYLPAARSGILHADSGLVPDALPDLPFLGMLGAEVPQASGVAAAFVGTIVSLPEEEGPFADLARELEDATIHGRILQRTHEEDSSPGFFYRFTNDREEVPLFRASSAAIELAPLVLYVRHLLAPGDLLVIEEPEAHLHPENQRHVARLFVQLVRRGVRLMITTHSDYLIEQLGNHVMRSGLTKKERGESPEYDADDYLKPDEVGCYLFEEQKRPRGFRIRELEVDAEYGIPPDSSSAVQEALYNERVKLRRKLGGKKGKKGV